jgi:hypothetical protein
MARDSDKVAVYLEIGKKRVLAGALDWPGWLRGGRDEESALSALLDYGPRYAKIMRAAGIKFTAPEDGGALKVVERVDGNATTDFGAPDVPPSVDTEPVDKAELTRLADLLKACWQAFDAATKRGRGKELRKGPRGGGRELDGIVEHVMGAESSYLSSLGGKAPKSKSAGDVRRAVEAQREVILETLSAASRGEIPMVGPRGGARWTSRYFVRRAAWHVLDHVWEIEDRII